MGIFKAYDIRGIVPDQLDAEMAYKIGSAFARLVEGKRLVVGQDMRTHSPEIADAVANGMRDAGATVLRLGLASTPMTYHGIGSLECDGGLVVTASHNTGEWNGFKLCRAAWAVMRIDDGSASHAEQYEFATQAELIRAPDSVFSYTLNDGVLSRAVTGKDGGSGMRRGPGGSTVSVQDFMAWVREKLGNPAWDEMK